MIGVLSPRPARLGWLRWSAAACLILALLCIGAPGAHAGTHAAAHAGAHAAGNNGHGPGNGNGNNGTGGGTATPELPSGVLFGLALVLAALVMLWRHRWRTGSAKAR